MFFGMNDIQQICHKLVGYTYIFFYTRTQICNVSEIIRITFKNILNCISGDRKLRNCIVSNAKVR